MRKSRHTSASWQTHNKHLSLSPHERKLRVIRLKWTKRKYKNDQIITSIYVERRINLDIKNGTLQSILFAACIKQKKKYLQKTNAHFHLSIFFSFHWKQSKKHSYFWEEWLGDVTFFSFFCLKRFLHLRYHPQTPSGPPVVTIVESYGSRR